MNLKFKKGVSLLLSGVVMSSIGSFSSFAVGNYDQHSSNYLKRAKAPRDFEEFRLKYPSKPKYDPTLRGDGLREQVKQHVRFIALKKVIREFDDEAALNKDEDFNHLKTDVEKLKECMSGNEEAQILEKQSKLLRNLAIKQKENLDFNSGNTLVEHFCKHGEKIFNNGNHLFKRKFNGAIDFGKLSEANTKGIDAKTFFSVDNIKEYLKKSRSLLNEIKNSPEAEIHIGYYNETMTWSVRYNDQFIAINNDGGIATYYHKSEKKDDFKEFDCFHFIVCFERSIKDSKCSIKEDEFKRKICYKGCDLIKREYSILPIIGKHVLAQVEEKSQTEIAMK